MEKVYENKDICAKCGGYCCKKCGCDYLVSDFDSLKLEYLDKVLATGRVSIIATLSFKNLPNGKLAVTPILSLRSRNIERNVIDLLSLKKSCAMLTSNGCIYSLDERPSGGVHLIPNEKDFHYCHSDIDKIKELYKWLPYQKVLAKLIKKYTGKSVMAKLKEDVINLFCAIIIKGYQDIAYEELVDINDMLPLLEQAFPEELQQAFNLCRPTTKKI